MKERRRFRTLSVFEVRETRPDRRVPGHDVRDDHVAFILKTKVCGPRARVSYCRFFVRPGTVGFAAHVRDIIRVRKVHAHAEHKLSGAAAREERFSTTTKTTETTPKRPCAVPDLETRGGAPFLDYACLIIGTLQARLT